jgi:hypothetical protein
MGRTPTQAELTEPTARVYRAVYPVAACWESSLLLRDVLRVNGWGDARVVAVRIGTYEEHCVVLCDEYICDPTAFQFTGMPDYVVVSTNSSECQYEVIKPGDPAYDDYPGISPEECSGYEAVENGVVDEAEYKRLVSGGLDIDGSD